MITDLLYYTNPLQIPNSVLPDEYMYVAAVSELLDLEQIVAVALVRFLGGRAERAQECSLTGEVVPQHKDTRRS